MRQKSLLSRARKVQLIVRKYYEEGRRDRSKRAIWQNCIRDDFHITYRTLLRYLRTDTSELDSKADPDPQADISDTENK